MHVRRLRTSVARHATVPLNDSPQPVTAMCQSPRIAADSGSQNFANMQRIPVGADRETAGGRANDIFVALLEPTTGGVEWLR